MNSNSLIEESIKDFIRIKDMLGGFTSQLSQSHQDLYAALLSMFDSYIIKHQSLLLNSSSQYTDTELDAMCLNAELQELKIKFNKLQDEHKHLQINFEELQSVYVETCDELEKIQDSNTSLLLKEEMRENYRILKKDDSEFWVLQRELYGVVPAEKYERLYDDYYNTIRELNKCVNDRIQLSTKLEL